MKVYDLYTGREVELPPTDIPNGRYRLTQAYRLNAEVSLARGDVLWRLGDSPAFLARERAPEERVAIHFGQAPVDDGTHGVISLSIAAVVSEWFVEEDQENLPSPLLPAVLQDRTELLGPEPELEHALATGQWDEIAVRPRLDMHYVPETLPVARAKRVHPSAVEHLSQHSELWAKRTINGVVPARVLSRVSEDDHAIYENIVFARLLDRCVHWLNRRIAEVGEIADSQSKALTFEKSEERHRLLRDRICSVWGGAWFSEGADAQKTRETLLRLEQMKSHAERLRRTGVYPRVPRSARVPLRLRPTNIFQYDKRYRELRAVWDALVAASAEDRVSDSERYESIKSEQAAFHRYVVLLLCHALRDLGAEKRSSSPLRFSVGPWEVDVETGDATEITLVIRASGERLQTRTLVLLLAKEVAPSTDLGSRSFVYAQDLTPADPSAARHEAPDVLNPFRFFAVEHIRHILERDFGRLFLLRYPPAVERVPRVVRERLVSRATAVFKPDGDRLLVVPTLSVSPNELDASVSEACADHPDTGASLRQAIKLGHWLLRCRACGLQADKSTKLSADVRALRLECSYCGLRTTVRTSPSRSLTSRFDDVRSGFEFAGGVELDVSGTESPR